MFTPWGASDEVVAYAPGITFYGTPSHGGFRLSAEREHELDVLLQARGLSAEQARMGYRPGWYEEDCCANAVAFAWPVLFVEAGQPTGTILAKSEEALAQLRYWVNYHEEAHR